MILDLPLILETRRNHASSTPRSTCWRPRARTACRAFQPDGYFILGDVTTGELRTARMKPGSGLTRASMNWRSTPAAHQHRHLPVLCWHSCVASASGQEITLGRLAVIPSRWRSPHWDTPSPVPRTRLQQRVTTEADLGNYRSRSPPGSKRRARILTK